MVRKHHGEYVSEQVVSIALDRQLIWRLLGYLRPYRAWMMIALFFLLISKIIEASLPVFIGDVSQKILAGSGLSLSEKDAMFNGILHECLMILALFLLSYLFDSGNVILRSWIGQKSIYTFRRQVYEHMLRMPLSYFDKNSVGRLMTRTIHDIDQINLMFAESVIPIVGSLFLFTGMFIGIVIIDWRIAVFVVAASPLIWWLTHRFRVMQRLTYDRLRTVVSAMNTFIQEHLMGVSTVRNFGLQGKTLGQFEKINEDQYNVSLEGVEHFCFFISAIEFLQNLSLIIAFVLIASFVTGTGEFQAGIYFTFSLYVAMFFRPLADLAERYDLLQSAMAAAARVFDVLDTPTEKATDPGKRELDNITSIVFQDVWFGYEKDNWVLKGLSLSFKKGESSALVGMTGEGKSTVMSLLLRFYEQQKGSIKINGHDIREYTLVSLRKHFSVVLQDPVIFSGTIVENISLFSPDIPLRQIEEVIHYLGMNPFINRFDEGIQHSLSEQGKGLSVGERQLVSLARAMAQQRQVVIMDEATANIDSNTENIIQEALKKILSHTTAIVIAHRLSTIKDVSRIYVLQDGKVVEEGSHENLLKREGIYEKLYQLQFT